MSKKIAIVYIWKILGMKIPCCKKFKDEESFQKYAQNFPIGKIMKADENAIGSFLKGYREGLEGTESMPSKTSVSIQTEPIIELIDYVCPKNCPKCQTTDIKKASLMYESEIKSLDLSTAGVGGGIGSGGNKGVGVFGASSRGTQVSLLAQRLAPPKEAHAGGGVVFAFIGAIFFTICSVACFIDKDSSGGVVTGIIAVLCYSYFSGNYSKFKSEEERLKKVNIEERKKWENSWFCTRCGEVFFQTK